MSIIEANLRGWTQVSGFPASGSCVAMILLEPTSRIMNSMYRGLPTELYENPQAITMHVTQQSQVSRLPVISHHCAGHRRHGTNPSATRYGRLSVRREQHQNGLHTLKSSTYSCRSRVHAGCARAEISYIMVNIAPMKTTSVILY